MKPPACDPGDFCMAQRAESTLFIPEIAKSTRASERISHVIRFAFLEVGFIGGIVGVRVAFNLDMSLDSGTSS